MRRWWLVGVVVLAACGDSSESALKQLSAVSTTTSASTTTTVAATTEAAPPPTTVATTTTAPKTTVGPIDVLHTAGRNETDTDVFTVDGVWQIACRVSGGAGVAAEIKKRDGSLSDYVSFEPGDGVSVKRQGGTFYLSMSPFGSTWDCTVTDLPG